MYYSYISNLLQLVYVLDLVERYYIKHWKPAIILIVLFNSTSNLLVCALFNHTGAQYLAVEKTILRAAVRRTFACAPQFDQASFCIILFLELTFLVVFSIWHLYIRLLSRCTPKYLGVLLWKRMFPSISMFSLFSANDC